MIKQKTHSAKSFIFSYFLACLVGLICAGACAAFLLSLDWVTQLRLASSPQYLSLTLPISGLLIFWSYERNPDLKLGLKLILQNLKYGQGTLPILLAPLIYLSTIFTHLCGGSSGRESTALQLSAGVSESLLKLFKVDVTAKQRKNLLSASLAAGFASAIGTPLAGIIFTYEVQKQKWREKDCLLTISLATFASYGFFHLLDISHFAPNFTTHYQIDTKLIMLSILAGVIFGFATKLYFRLFEIFIMFFEKLKSWTAGYVPVIFCSTVMIISYFAFPHTIQNQGLGIDVITQTFSTPQSWNVFLEKILFTAWTLAGGFKGGEFTPFVYIGTSLGSSLTYSLSQWISHIPAEFLPSLGFAALFAAANQTPLACAIMAAEIFGFDLALYAIFACYCSSIIANLDLKPLN